MYNVYFWINTDNEENLKKIEQFNSKNKNSKIFKAIDEDNYLFESKIGFIPKIDDKFNIHDIYGLDGFEYVKVIELEYRFSGDYNQEADLEIDVMCDIY